MCQHRCYLHVVNTLDFSRSLLPTGQVSRMGDKSPFPLLTVPLSLSQVQRKKVTTKNVVFFSSFSIHKFPSRDFVRINFRIYFRGENLFTYLWKLLLCDCIFHSKWVVIKWNRHDYASFTIWTNIVSSLLRFSNLFTSHLNGLITHVLGGIFL